MNVLFVCTGNTCRSPMAEKIFLKYLCKEKIENVWVLSAGLAADGVSPISENSVYALKQLGIDDVEHTSNILTIELLKEADLVLTMTASQKEYLKDFDNVYSLKEYLDVDDIVDPYGKSKDDYLVCAKQIDAAMQKLIKKIEEM